MAQRDRFFKRGEEEMRFRRIILEEASFVEEIKDTGSRAIHGDLKMVLEVLLDIRNLLVKIEKK